jgi:hypothetical protein
MVTAPWLQMCIHGSSQRLPVIVFIQRKGGIDHKEKLKDLLYFYVCICVSLVCMCTCVHVPLEARRGHQRPWSWSMRRGWDTWCRFSERAMSTSNCWAISSVQMQTAVVILKSPGPRLQKVGYCIWGRSSQLGIWCLVMSLAIKTLNKRQTGFLFHLYYNKMTFDL